MYLQTDLGDGVFKPRSRYKQPRLYLVSVHWTFEVPFRKDFEAFRQELSKTIRKLVTAEADKKEIDSLLLEAKHVVTALKDVHGQLLKRKSPRLKESDPVGINATIYFKKNDYTDVSGISVYDRN
ncbi:MAG: hypothetical protein AABZ34_04320 [Nitrospirota bacterium]